MFVKRLSFFLSGHIIISNSQYGFRAKMSTCYACRRFLLYFIELIGVFVDFREAFDTVDHSISFKKLEFYDICSVLGDFLRSYLSNRLQFYFTAQHRIRDWYCMHVPQGSVIGPILFNMYINNIVPASDKFKYDLFADNTKNTFFFYFNQTII